MNQRIFFPKLQTLHIPSTTSFYVLFGLSLGLQQRKRDTITYMMSALTNLPATLYTRYLHMPQRKSAQKTIKTVIMN